MCPHSLLLHSYVSTVYLHICALLSCLRLLFIHLFIHFVFILFSTPPTYLGTTRLLALFFFFFILLVLLLHIFEVCTPPRLLALCSALALSRTSLPRFLIYLFIYFIFWYSYTSCVLLACSRSARRSHSAALLSHSAALLSSVLSARSLANCSANCCEFASVHFCTKNASTFVLAKQVN